MVSRPFYLRAQSTAKPGCELGTLCGLSLFHPARMIGFGHTVSFHHLRHYSLRSGLPLCDKNRSAISEEL